MWFKIDVIWKGNVISFFKSLSPAAHVLAIWQLPLQPPVVFVLGSFVYVIHNISNACVNSMAQLVHIFH
jgi:hypothetical protein